MLVKDKDITYLFWDIGVTSNYNDNIYAWLFRDCTRDIMLRTIDGTVLDVSEISTSVAPNVTPNTSNFYTNYIEKGSCVEFDVVEVDTSNSVNFITIIRRDGASPAYPSINLHTYTVPFHVKINYNDNGIQIWVNDTEIPQSTYNDIVNYRSYFNFPSNTRGTYVKYKNFVLYSI